MLRPLKEKFAVKGQKIRQKSAREIGNFPLKKSKISPKIVFTVTFFFMGKKILGSSGISSTCGSGSSDSSGTYSSGCGRWW